MLVRRASLPEFGRVEIASWPGSRVQPNRVAGLRRGGLTYAVQRGRFAQIDRDVDPGCSLILIEFHVFSQQISALSPIHFNFLPGAVIAPGVSRIGGGHQIDLGVVKLPRYLP